MASKTVKNTIVNDSTEPKRRTKPIIRSNLEQPTIEVLITQINTTINDSDEENPNNSDKIKSQKLLGELTDYDIDYIFKELKDTIDYNELIKLIKYFPIFNCSNTNIDNLIYDDSQSENFDCDTFINGKVFRTLFTDSKILHMPEINKNKFKLVDLIKAFLKTKDSFSMSKYHEYLLFHNFLFNIKAENCPILINYTKSFMLKNNDAYKRLYYAIKPRFENRVIFWMLQQINNDPIIKGFKHLIDIDYQLNNEEDKKYDICLMNNIIIEIQEANKNHDHNPNDVAKKNMAITDNKLIVYFKEANYRDKNKNKIEVLNEFWNELRGHIIVLCCKNNDANLRKYTELWYIDQLNNKLEIMRQSNLLKLDANNRKRKNIEIAIKTLEDKINSNNTALLHKVFRWKDDTENLKDKKVIDLDSILLELNPIEKTNSVLKQEIIDKYSHDMKIIDINSSINYYIDWDQMTDIVLDGDNISSRNNLFSYLKSVDTSYKEFIKYAFTYSDKLIKLNTEYHNSIKADIQTKNTKIVNELKDDIKQLKETVDDYQEVQRKTISACNKVKEYIDVCIPNKTLIKEFNDILSKNILYDEAQKVKNKMKSSYSEINLDIVGPIFNRTGFPIHWTGNFKNRITPEIFESKCNIWKIPTTLRNKFLECNDYDYFCLKLIDTPEIVIPVCISEPIINDIVINQLPSAIPIVKPIVKLTPSKTIKKKPVSESDSDIE